jgi:hypothetical protein
VQILICECGMRLKAPGAKPGRVGRCPECGRRLQVPGSPEPFRLKPDSDEPATANVGGSSAPITTSSRDRVQPFRLKPDDDLPPTTETDGAPEPLALDDWTQADSFRRKPTGNEPRVATSEETGTHAASVYQLLPESSPARDQKERPASVEELPPYIKERKPRDTRPMADGLLPVLERPESNRFASFLYPLRSIECISVMAVLSMVFWVFLILVPEYCLSVMGDADSMGVPTIGKFIALISILPVLFLSPLILFYWLQYLARVLVFSAMGDTMPPRTPDRNFDGFFSGLSPWFVWLLLGCSVGSLPVVAYGFYQHSAQAPWSWPLAALFVLPGFPYVVMALLISFLHDHALAANPLNVTVAMLRLGFSFLLLCADVLVTLGSGALLFAITFRFREGYFWIYLALCLASWLAVAWCSIVTMRVLGNYYYPRRKSLRWNQERPRWGVAWKL